MKVDRVVLTRVFVSFFFIFGTSPKATRGFSAPLAGRFIVEKLGHSAALELKTQHALAIQGNPRVRRTILFAKSIDLTGTMATKAGNEILKNEDSIKAFADNLATVFHELRAEKNDPTMPKLFRETPQPSFTNTWTLEDWDRHTSRLRFWDHIRTFPSDRLLIRCAPQLAVFVTWSCLASWACHVGKLKVLLPLTPLSLLSTFVAALISLRSNQGLSRLNEGRKAFGNTILYTRDMAQLVASNIYPKDPQLGLKILRHLSLFGWLCKNFIRGEEMNGTDEDIIREMLPTPGDAEYVLRQRKKPVAVVTRLRQVFHDMGERGLINHAEELALDHLSSELNHCITSIERIRASPIPPLYTAHTGRLLIFYLILLPVALTGVLDWLGVVLTTAAMAYTMLGLDEISHLLEQPFKLMPLYQLSKNSMRDVGDAIVCQPPPLYPDSSSFSLDNFQAVDPPYWDDSKIVESGISDQNAVA